MHDFYLRQGRKHYGKSGKKNAGYKYLPPFSPPCFLMDSFSGCKNPGLCGKRSDQSITCMQYKNASKTEQKQIKLKIDRH